MDPVVSEIIEYKNIDRLIHISEIQYFFTLMLTSKVEGIICKKKVNIAKNKPKKVPTFYQYFN